MPLFNPSATGSFSGTSDNVSEGANNLFNRQDFIFSAARLGLSNISMDLVKKDGLTTNLSPYIIPFNCELRKVTVHADASGQYRIAVLKNDTIIPALQFSVNNSGSNTFNLTELFSENDEVRIRYEYLGNVVSNPSVALYFRES